MDSQLSVGMDAVAEGDLVGIARKTGSSEANHQLSMNLMGVGNYADSLDSLLQEHPNWSFWIAASHWIHGDKERAISLLQSQNTAEAQKLLAQIQSPQIHVVGQFAWPHSSFQDDKFRIHHVGIQRHNNLPDGSQEINITAPTNPFLIELQFIILPDGSCIPIFELNLSQTGLVVNTLAHLTLHYQMKIAGE